ncbi:MAG TPA: DNA-processing protein DprA [Candidatus Saccharimonadia bacterium]
MQISRISSNDSEFPDVLRALANPPKSINVLGKMPFGHYVAIVGTRKCTAYGRQITYQLARDLARAGAVIVSGLAAGVDGIAHQAALDVGGKTVAVLGHGLNRIYPHAHRPLAMDILAGGGALVSEYDLGVPPLPHHFVERNRIIAGLSEALIVTEAGVDSGALITANAMKQLQRRIMAVPGNLTSPSAAGPNNLIYDGALFIRSASDVIADLGYLTHEPIPVPARSPQEAKLLELMGKSTATADALIEASGLSAAEFANIISLMEITGKVRNLGAGLWAAR